MDNVVIIDDEDDDTGTSTCDISSDNEQDDHDSCIEINSGNVISDTELDGDDESIESDSSSNKNTSSLSKQTVEQNPNAWPPSSQSTDLYEDDEGDKVLLATDSDLVAAVNYARLAGLKVRVWGTNCKALEIIKSSDNSRGYNSFKCLSSHVQA